MRITRDGSQNTAHSMFIILNIGIVYCTWEHFLRKGRGANQQFIKYTMDLLSIPEYVIKKGRLHGHRYGKKPGDREYCSANQLKKKCKKSSSNEFMTGSYEPFSLTFVCSEGPTVVRVMPLVSSHASQPWVGGPGHAPLRPATAAEPRAWRLRRPCRCCRESSVAMWSLLAMALLVLSDTAHVESGELSCGAHVAHTARLA